MAKSRKFLTAGAVGVAALALIGAGASATFTDEVNATQTVTAGHMNLTVSGPGGISNGGKTITLPAFSHGGSTFETPATTITVTNNGDITVMPLAFQMSESHDGNSAASNALLAQTNVCIKSTDPSSTEGGGTWVEGNGPLTTAVALNPTVVQSMDPGNFLAPGATMTFSVSFYAGKDSAQCGGVTSDGGGTTSRWASYSGAYHTPASLTDAAQNGVITPTLTFKFKG